MFLGIGHRPVIDMNFLEHLSFVGRSHPWWVGEYVAQATLHIGTRSRYMSQRLSLWICTLVPVVRNSNTPALLAATSRLVSAGPICPNVPCTSVMRDSAELNPSERGQFTLWDFVSEIRVDRLLRCTCDFSTWECHLFYVSTARKMICVIYLGFLISFIPRGLDS